MVAFCGLQLAHPIVNGSGTFDALAAGRVFGDAVLGPPGAAGGGLGFPFSAYVSKTITLAPRAGNPPPRLWESPAGMVNSIGLPNQGVAAYLAEDLPRYAALPVPLITNVMGSTGEELAEVTALVGDRPEVAAIELNVSCPNVATGLDIGAVPAELETVVRRVRSVTGKPLIVKLTPNTADVSLCAQAAEAAGADAVSLINTLRAAPLHPDGTGGRWLGGRQGGLSGPAIRAVALAQIAAVDRFTNNMLAYPGRMFGQLYHRFFRVNDLADGRVAFEDGEAISLADVSVPVLVVAGSNDVLAPRQAVHHVADLLTGSPDVRVETATGGHLGVRTGRSAHRTTWRYLDEFLRDYDSRQAGELPAPAAWIPSSSSRRARASAP